VLFDGGPKHSEQREDQQDNCCDQQNRAGETDAIGHSAIQRWCYRVRTDSNRVKEAKRARFATVRRKFGHQPLQVVVNRER
jgi:hypothetical protein